MGKVRYPIIKISGRVGDLVIVNSATYGKHTRAARGSIKEAKVNEVFERNCTKTETINEVCRQLHGILLKYCRRFKYGQLWQEMLSRAQKSNDESLEGYISQFNGLEMNKSYRFSELMHAQPPITVNYERKSMTVAVTLQRQPYFGKDKQVSSYTIGVVVIFPSQKGSWTYMEAFSETIPAGDTGPGTLEYEFEMPAKAKSYLVAMVVIGQPQNGGDPSVWSSRMQIVDAGILEHSTPAPPAKARKKVSAY